MNNNWALPAQEKGNYVVGLPKLSTPSVRWPCRRIGALLATLAIGLASPAIAQFTPNEALVSPNRGLVDAEYSQSRARIVWTDPLGNLWLGGINRATGAFEPVSGKGLLIATGAVSKWNMFLWNGPEWISMASGDQISYSHYLPGKPRTAANTRMALAVQDQSGAWVTQTLSPNLPRMSNISSDDPGDSNARIMYFDPYLNHYWRNVLDPSSEQILAFLPQTNKAWRFARGVRAVLYTAPVNGVPQVFRYMLDTQASEQLTSDSGAKDTERTVPWMWPAPEFGGDFVFSTFVNGSELRVYRRLVAPNGALQWRPIYSASLPAGRTAGSPQWFIYNGKSYLYWTVYVSPNDFPSEIWISNIDSGKPLLRRISDDKKLRVRNDPEHFITTNSGPLIYYNRYDPSIDPAHPMCSACSEGVFSADAGLAGS